jgi:hypothetical protein
MTAKQVAAAIGFGVLWTVLMIWWSKDYTAVNIAIFTVMGLILGIAWMWVMKRFGYFRF